MAAPLLLYAVIDRFATDGSRHITCDIADIEKKSSSSTSKSAAVDAAGGRKRRCTVLKYSAMVDGRPVVGQPFAIDSDFLSSVGFPINADATIRRQPPPAVPDFVVVTGADSNYLHVNLDAIGTVQKFFPNHRIIFYDLSTHRSSPLTVEKIRSLCNVEFVAFNYSRYPPHVRRLQNYAWKPIIVHEALRSHDAVFWIDSSIRFLWDDIGSVVRLADSNGGIAIVDSTGHSIFAATHAGLYRYLPIDKSVAVTTNMFGAGATLVYRKSQIYTEVIRWWFLCALTADCIAPTTDIYCNFTSGPETASTYGHCHRYDQSALNVLLANHFNAPNKRADGNSLRKLKQQSSFRLSDFYAVPTMSITVMRGSQHQQPIRVCPLVGDNKSAANYTVVEYFGSGNSWKQFFGL